MEIACRFLLWGGIYGPFLANPAGMGRLAYVNTNRLSYVLPGYAYIAYTEALRRWPYIASAALRRGILLIYATPGDSDIAINLSQKYLNRILSKKPLP